MAPPAHLWSPAALAFADTGGKYKLPKHLEHLNGLLVNVGYARGEGARVIVNMMQQVGKSTMVCVYFVAWVLLMWPDTRVIILCGTEDLATKFGRAVRDCIDRWGGAVGVRLRKDTRAAHNWLIEGARGGVICKSRTASPSGEEADLFLIDDLILTPDEALSEAVLETNWRLVSSVVLGRLRRETSLLMVGTRWTRKDHFARMLEAARQAGELERWQVIKYAAIAEAGDVLGRAPGEHLWPEHIAPRDVEFARRVSPFFEAAWQQRPPDEEGARFKPRAWPRYADLSKDYGQRAYNVPVPGGRSIVFARDLTTLVTCDWAGSERRWADFTGFGAWGVLPDRRLLLLEVKWERWPLDAVVPHLAAFCRFWRPDVVACDADGFQSALANECRRFPEIGEVRRVKSHSKTKLQRALPAIILGENGRILLPEGAPWLDGYCTQLAQFTGDGAEHDDLVDLTSTAAQQVQHLAPGDESFDGGPQVLTEGKSLFW